MGVYFIADIKIKDKMEYQKYLDGTHEIFIKYKGKLLAVDDNPKLIEGGWEKTRIVMMEFPDEAEFNKWYYSKEYQELVKHRFNASEGNAILVKKLEAH